MLQLTIREFNYNISKSFKTLPVEITLRGYGVVRSIPPDWFWKEVVEKAGEKYKADAIKTITKIKVVNKAGAEVLCRTLDTPAPKNVGERSSVKMTPSPSAPPPPPASDTIPPLPPPLGGQSGRDTIPKLRKKLCLKHSVFSCGCPEKK